MAAAPDYVETQRAEMMALESIFGDSFKLVTAPPPRDPLAIQTERVNQPFHFTIRLVPHPADMKDERNHSWVTLDVTFTPTYPKKIPTIKLEKGEGLSNAQLKTLRTKISRETNKLVGNEMIYLLAQLIQDFLLDHNEKPQSFYEEMVEREKKEKAELKQRVQKERAAAHDQQSKERNDLVKLIELEQQRKEALINAQRQKRKGGTATTAATATDAPGSEQIDLAAAGRDAIAALSVTLPSAAAAATAASVRTPKTQTPSAADEEEDDADADAAADENDDDGEGDAVADEDEGDDDDDSASGKAARPAVALSIPKSAPVSDSDDVGDDEVVVPKAKPKTPTRGTTPASANKLGPAPAVVLAVTQPKPAPTAKRKPNETAPAAATAAASKADVKSYAAALSSKPAAATATTAASKSATAPKPGAKPATAKEADSGEDDDGDEDEEEDDEPAPPTKPKPAAAPAPAPAAANAIKSKPVATAAPAPAAAPTTAAALAALDESVDGEFVSFDFKSAVQMIDRDKQVKKEQTSKARALAKQLAAAAATTTASTPKPGDEKKSAPASAALSQPAASAPLAKPKSKDSGHAESSDDGEGEEEDDDDDAEEDAKDDGDGDEDEDEEEDDEPKAARSSAAAAKLLTTAAAGNAISNRFNPLSPPLKQSVVVTPATPASAVKPKPGAKSTASAATPTARSAANATAKKLASPQLLAVPAPGSKKSALPAQPPALSLQTQRAPSRFETDFEQLGLLGRGGFGEVLKVRNKLDGLYYAIKRIKLKRGHMAKNKKIIREVSTIARLHHRYIVRYFQAWIEGGTEPDPEKSASSKKGGRRKRRALPDGAAVGGEDDEDWLKPSVSTYGGGHGDDDEDDEGEDGADPDDDDEEDEDDDEGEDDETGSDDDSSSSAAGGGASKASNGRHQFLYIQMEYCPNKTLRDLIDEKVMNNPETVWRLFRQTLEAIAEIHRKGIMHRDIKPPNIFIDSQGNIKLGDFGLAVAASDGGGGGDANTRTPQQAADTKKAAADSKDAKKDKPKRGPKDDAESVTEGVGTPFYRAPEQESSVEYDHKADIFSLGVIFYEMWRPFSTLMERANHLLKLRERGTVPEDFTCGPPGDTATKESVRKIIEWLLQKQPAYRPNATDLLKSGLIPLKLEDEYMDLALKAVTDRDSPFHARLMDQLFASGSVDAVTDFTYDYAAGGNTSAAGAGSGGSSAPRTPHHQHLKNVVPPHLRNLVQMQTFDRVINLFRMHGGVLFETPLIAPKTDKVLERTNPAAYLDSSGVLIQLPFTLTVPFARAVAQKRVLGDGVEFNAGGEKAAVNVNANGRMSGIKMDMRRYDISKVYRKSLNGGRPKELYECTFDIVWSNRHSRMGSRGDSNSHLSSLANSSSNKKSKDSRQKAREKAALLEAECIKMCEEILREFSTVLGGQYSIRINHLDVFDALLDAILRPHIANTPAGLAAAAAAAAAEGTSSTSAPSNATTNAAALSALLVAPSTAGGPNTTLAGLTAASTAAATKEAGAKSLTAAGAASLAAALAATMTARAASAVAPPTTFFMNTASASAAASKDSKSESAPVLQARALGLLRKEIYTLASQRVIGVPWIKSNMRRILIREKKMPVKSVDYLGALLMIVGEPGKTDTVIRKVQQALGTLHGTGSSGGSITGSDDGDARLMDAFEHMKLTFAALETFGLTNKVVWDAGLVGNYDLYCGGMVFQAFAIHSGKATSGSSADSASHSGSGATPSPTPAGLIGTAQSGTMDVVAVGGRYDSLIARFVPPNSTQTPISAVGMNVAIEKIMASTIALYTSTHEARALNRRIRARELMRGCHISSESMRSSVLLFCTRGNMMNERASVANSLWEDSIPAQYMHPKSLTLPHIRQYCMELGIRFLVVFNQRTVKTTNFVTIKDLHVDSRADGAGGDMSGVDGGGTGGSSGSKGSKAGGGGGSASGGDQSVFQINMKDIRAFIKGRFKQYVTHSDLYACRAHPVLFHVIRKRDREADASDSKSGGSGSSGSSSSSTSGSLLNVTILDPSKSMKSFHKNQTLTLIKRALGPILQNHHTGPYLILAVDLPLSTIRNITTAYYNGSNAQFESNKHKALQDTVLRHITAFAKDPAQVSKTIKLIFVYSIAEHSFDVVSIPSNSK